MFLRFVLKQIDPDSRQPKGLFVIAHNLLDEKYTVDSDCVFRTATTDY
jgi:hypothetical protein